MYIYVQFATNVTRFAVLIQAKVQQELEHWKILPPGHDKPNHFDDRVRPVVPAPSTYHKQIDPPVVIPQQIELIPVAHPTKIVNKGDPDSGNSSSSVIVNMDTLIKPVATGFHALKCPHSELMEFWKETTPHDWAYKTPYTVTGETKYVTFEPGTLYDQPPIRCCFCFVKCLISFIYPSPLSFISSIHR